MKQTVFNKSDELRIRRDFKFVTSDWWLRSADYRNDIGIVGTVNFNGFDDIQYASNYVDVLLNCVI